MNAIVKRVIGLVCYKVVMWWPTPMPSTKWFGWMLGWAGWYADPGSERCDKCGAEITTGFMAVYCKLGDSCEFFPENPDAQDFVRDLRRGQ